MLPVFWLVFGCLAFLGGITLGLLGVTLHPWLEFVMLLAVGLSLLVFRFEQNSRHRLFVFVTCFVFFFFGLGFWRAEPTVYRPSQFENWYGQKREFYGLVKEADLRVDRLLVNVVPDGFSEAIQLRLSSKAQVFYGDRVWVFGKISAPKSSEDFNYAKFLSTKEVGAVSFHPKILVMKSGQGFWFFQKLDTLKREILGRLRKELSLNTLGLIGGVLVGHRGDLPKSIAEDFTSAGVSHILVVSGYNLSVLAVFMGGLAGLFGRKKAQILAILVILGFMGLVGFSASVVRAGIMALLLIWAKFLGRQYSALPALVFAASLMVAKNPEVLLWDVGFQLSFAATLGIIWLSPKLENLLNFASWSGLVPVLSTSLSAILFTLPLLTFHFERVSILALPANLLVVPFVPILMALGTLSLLPIFGGFFASLSEIFASYVIQVAHFFANVSWGLLDIKIGILAVFAFYLCLFVLVRMYGRNFSGKSV